MQTLLSLVLLSVVAHAVNADIYKEPVCNTLRYRAGCMLDGLEKACESVKDLSKCASNPATCKEADERLERQQRVHAAAALDPFLGCRGRCPAREQGRGEEEEEQEAAAEAQKLDRGHSAPEDQELLMHRVQPRTIA